MVIKYPIAELFSSVQGEGADTGMPVTFVRFAGCNLRCSFCDTEFTAHAMWTVDQIVKRCGHYVVFTGGEPLMQDLEPLVDALQGRILGLETNGTYPIPKYLAMRCCNVSLSPKVPRKLCKVEECYIDSLKILFPYLKGVHADDWMDVHAAHKSIQVIDPDKKENIPPAIKEVQRLGFPWRLGIQLHKMIGAR